MSSRVVYIRQSETRHGRRIKIGDRGGRGLGFPFCKDSTLRLRTKDVSFFLSGKVTAAFDYAALSNQQVRETAVLHLADTARSSSFGHWRL